MTIGRLYGLGLGRGDPEVVTLKALRLLRAAPVVAYPAPEDGESFARTIVAEWLDRGQPEISNRFPMRPRPPPAPVYEAAAAQLAPVMETPHHNAYFCQGGPLVFPSFAVVPYP